MFTYYNHYGSVTRNANVVCPRDARAIEVLRGETHFSVLGSKARAGELTGGTPVRCFVIDIWLEAALASPVNSFSRIY